MEPLLVPSGPLSPSATCCVISDARLDRKGSVCYDPRQSFPQDHWSELLNTFDAVEIYTRVSDATGEFPAHLVLPEGVRVIESPFFIGLRQLIGTLVPLWRSVWRLTANERLFILRGPGVLAYLAAFALLLRRKPYAVEVLGDSAEAIRLMSLPFRRLLSIVVGFCTRVICRRAFAVLYISHYLARRYRAGFKSLVAVISDVRLPPEIWQPPREHYVTDPATLVMVANMEQPYKGHDSLLRALARLRARGMTVRVWFVGQGRERPRLEAFASQIGVRAAVEFRGVVPWGPELFAVLDGATLFVLPSLTEGLGKALLEAMARGVPAIGSDVGGIPELLPDDARFPAGDDAAMAEMILRFLNEPHALQRLATRCFERARAFDSATLSRERHAYYSALRSRFEHPAV